MRKKLILLGALIFPLTWVGAANSVQKVDHGILVTSDAVVVKIQPWSPRTLRVEAVPSGTIPEKKSLAVIADPNPIGWKATEDGATVQLKGQNLRAVVNKQSGLISFFDGRGQLLCEQKAWQFKPARNAARDGLELGSTFSRAPGERYFGGGVVGSELRQTSAEIDFSNDNTRIRIPVLYSTRGYGIFWDNPSRGKLILTPDSATWNSTAGDLADFYIMEGTTADQVIAEYRNLTGAAPLFPKWAYGFWFSRDRFTRQQEILDAANGFRSREFPLDLLIQDYYYWKEGSGGANWGSHEFDPGRYPDPKDMIDTLHNQDHLHFMAVTWAKFHPNTAHYKELEAVNGLFPPHSDWAGPLLRYYDPFNPKARELYGKQVVDSLFSLGLDGFWIDGAEPEMDLNKFASFDSETGPISRKMNAFPMVHAEGIYKSQRAATDQKRVVLLPRSAWAGFQRCAACNWTGDIKQNWQTLAWQIEALPNFSISGIPYITTDIGGYQADTVSESDRELFVRWFQWGTFCPIYRVHGTGRPFPWEYGTEAEAILKQFDILRYRLLPYIYSEAASITRDNGTLMRPLVMDFQNDTKALETWDEFMFGPSLLVCPVYQSSRERVASTVDQWADLDGKSGGLTATYLTKGNEAGVRTELKEEKPLLVRWGELKNETSGFRAKDISSEQSRASKIRVEGTYTPKMDGKFELEFPGDNYPETVTLDGHATTPDVPRERLQFSDYPLNCKAGVPIHFAFESLEKRPAFRIVHPLESVQCKEVYLPGKEDWYDFWTGKRLASQQTLKVETPLNMIPLYVRAGTILPMGPVIQYASEKAADPIELRVYRGADGSLNLYEDEGDSYNYEKGAFAEIPISWNEARQTLTFGKRKGSFPGMLATRTFHIVLVHEGHGISGETANEIDANVQYQGRAITVKMKP